MKKRYVLIGLGILFFVFLRITISWYDRKTERELATFISDKIEGKITYVFGGTGGEGFRLSNSKNTYHFIFNNLYAFNHFVNFSLVAKIGDSVFKPSFGDTLELIKKSGEVYKFTFKKSYKPVK